MRRTTLTQYTVKARGRDLTRLTGLLARERVGVRALVSGRAGGGALVHFLARKDAGLRVKLERAGWRVREHQIFELELPGHQWEFHKLARELARQGNGVISLFGAFRGGRWRMILAVDEPANAVAAAAQLGFAPEYSVC